MTVNQVKVLIAERNGVDLQNVEEMALLAGVVPFTNTANGFTADEVQGAIEEVGTRVTVSASPGFSFGRSGSVSKGAYLQNESVPSNISGRYVYINNAVVQRVFVSNEDVCTYKMGVYAHDGSELNITLLGTVTVSAARSGVFTAAWSVANGKQLAVRVESDSTDTPKNVVAGLELSGSR